MDLSQNKLTVVKDVEAAFGLPSLQRLILVGNPVVARSTAFTKTCNIVTLNLCCMSAHAYQVACNMFCTSHSAYNFACLVCS